MAKKQAAKKPASPELKDRIVELRRVRAGDLLPNPENWRTHGDDQMAALSGILGEVGIADAVLAFPADGLGPDGDSSKLMLFDGHARTERDPDQLWPVIVTDLTIDEARKMLAVTDPLAAMAGINVTSLAKLLDDMSSENDAVVALLADLQQQAIDLRFDELAQTDVPAEETTTTDDAESETTEAAEAGQFKTLNIPLTLGQEKAFREAIKAGKAKFQTETTGDTLAAILKEWQHGQNK